MKPILECMSTLLEKQELNFEIKEEDDVIMLSIAGKVANINILIGVQNDRIITITAFLPVNIPDKSHCHVLELINKINTEALVSTMYLDMSRKTVNCQSFLHVENDAVGEAAFNHSFYSTVCRIDERSEEILSVAYGMSTESLSELIMRKQIEESQNDEVVS